MESWEDKIKNKRSLFDDKDLPEGHLIRFEALLNKQEAIKVKVSKRFKPITIFSIAASVLLVIGVGFYFMTHNHNSNNPQIQISNEFYTTNEYYNQQMLEQIDNIMCKLSQADNETREQLTQDLESIINENSKFVTNIAQNDNEEMAIYYMVEHYKTNIQVLEFIDKKLSKQIEC